MLYTDCQVVLGVLPIGTIENTLAPQIPPNLETVSGDMTWAATQNQLTQIYPSGVANPGDLPILKPPK